MSNVLVSLECRRMIAYYSADDSLVFIVCSLVLALIELAARLGVCVCVCPCVCV